MSVQISLLRESVEGVASEASPVASGSGKWWRVSFPAQAGRRKHLSMEGASGRTRRAD
jgi:hypothetical protein